MSPPPVLQLLVLIFFFFFFFKRSLVLESGIFLSHWIWLFRTRKERRKADLAGMGLGQPGRGGLRDEESQVTRCDDMQPAGTDVEVEKIG
jgi:hypothetical protein